MKYYVGLRVDYPHDREVFTSRCKPTRITHGDKYLAVIGPFLTLRGAQFMAAYGKGNPHCQTVDDAERIAKQIEDDTQRATGNRLLALSKGESHV